MQEIFYLFYSTDVVSNQVTWENSHLISTMKKGNKINENENKYEKVKIDKDR